MNLQIIVTPLAPTIEKKGQQSLITARLKLKMEFYFSSASSSGSDSFDIISKATELKKKERNLVQAKLAELMCSEFIRPSPSEKQCKKLHI